MTAAPHTPSAPDEASLFQLLVESARDIGIYTTDLDGLVTSWNIGAERVFGFTHDEMLGAPSDVIFPPGDRDDGKEERQRALADGRAEDDRWHQRKDGSRFWASGLMMPLADGQGFVKIARDLTERHLTVQRLEASEERFRVLATNIPQLVFRTRRDGTRTWPSPQWIDFTGLSFEASLGEGWMDAVHPEDRAATAEGWIKAAETGLYYVEHRIWSKRDGEYRWHQTRARPVDTPAGSDEWVGTMTDIHDLRSLQDRQLVLMAELQQRTRNLLAVVQSIAKQTLRKASSPAAFGQELEGRLRALSRMQSLLAQGDLPDIDLRGLVEAELLAHDDEAVTSARVVVGGPPVSLPATSAQALALGLHELATNAVKHGALARPDGRLEVTWNLKTEASEPRVALQWRESGVPLDVDAPPKRQGYGRELIERALPLPTEGQDTAGIHAGWRSLCDRDARARRTRPMTMKPAHALQGRRVLVVEDEYLIAVDLAQSLEDAGGDVVGPVSSVFEALQLIESHERGIDAAVLDINLRDERVYPVADALADRDVPFVFATGYDAFVVPPRHAAIPRCEKPVDSGVLVKLLLNGTA